MRLPGGIKRQPLKSNHIGPPIPTGTVAAPVNVLRPRDISQVLAAVKVPVEKPKHLAASPESIKAFCGATSVIAEIGAAVDRLEPVFFVIPSPTPVCTFVPETYAHP